MVDATVVERRFRAVFDEVTVPAVVLDIDGRILDVNPAAERTTGRPRATLLGRSVGHLTTAHSAEEHRPRWRDLVSGRSERYELPGTVRHADGTLRGVLVTVALVRDRDGVPAGAVGLARPPVDRRGMPAGRRPSDAETDVLARLAAGRSIRQIADDLRLTRRGVDYRISQLRRKLRTEGPDGAPATTAALVARAYSLGILVPTTWPPHVDHGAVHGR